ncbi:MAG TPA: hypothetical protein VN461_01170 [Vicinamibacteria bacterium]|nr:hypothetical protein [Vicinamibacteria bacterium]
MPSGLALDRSGNVFVADEAGGRIRRIDAVSGIITTVAGTRPPGEQMDAGAAAEGPLLRPAGVALDDAGNLYIVDRGAQRLLRLDAKTGSIDTLAGDGFPGESGDGGPALKARLSSPQGVAVDDAGSLYIADRGNHRIRKISANRTISTVAGNGKAGFSGDGGPATAASLKDPSGVALDARGNLLIADAGNGRVRRVSTSGVISTLVGGATEWFSGDGRPSAEAGLGTPVSVAVAPSETLLIADARHCRIRRVDRSGIITTLAGNGVGFYGDGRPAAVRPEPRWAYRNEEAWIVGEITRDIGEMVAYGKDRSLLESGAITIEGQPSPSSSTGPPSFDVSVALPKAAPVSAVVVLDEHIWSPKSYLNFAQLLLGRAGLKAAAAGSVSQASLLGALTDLQASNLEHENQRISGMLAADIRDPLAHEQAAFLLGAFGLRESAGTFSDNRRTLSRMTAHLAMAEALRQTRPISLEGTYAETLLLTLAGRQRDAMDRLATGRARAPLQPPETAWVNALEMRNSHDYRVVADPPKASLLERLEYFRALSTSVGGPAVLELLQKRQPEAVPDWGRITLQENLGVQTGNVFASAAVAAEMGQLAEIWKLSRGQALHPDDAPKVLNMLPVRCIARREDGKIRPEALDWGSWAYSSQRHLCHALVEDEFFIRSLQGLKDEGASFRDEAARQFESLRLYPLVFFKWQSGLFDERTRKATTRIPGNFMELRKTKSEEEACDNTLLLFRDTPELPTASNWDRVFRVCGRARDSGALPDYVRWFSKAPLRGTAFDVDRRVIAAPADDAYGPLQLEGLLKLAPFQRSLVQAYVRLKYGNKLTLEQLDAAAGLLVGYDRGLMRERANLATGNPADYLRLASPLCDLNAGECLALGDYLADHEMDEPAALAYQRAVDAAPDRLAVAQDSDWLVNYYFDGGNKEKAVGVAQIAAAVYSGAGLQTMGRVLERLGNYTEAESFFKTIEQRYNRPTELLSFYIRREHRAPGSGFAAQAANALKALFPQGLELVSLSDFSAPPSDQNGLRIGQTTGKLRRFGIKVGDVIVAIDGYRIGNEDQYLCVRGFTDDPNMTVVVWRAGRYVEIKGLFKRRRFGP